MKAWPQLGISKSRKEPGKVDTVTPICRHSGRRLTPWSTWLWGHEHSVPFDISPVG
jgi:hypothetical protein